MKYNLIFDQWLLAGLKDWKSIKLKYCDLYLNKKEFKRLTGEQKELFRHVEAIKYLRGFDIVTPVERYFNKVLINKTTPELIFNKIK